MRWLTLFVVLGISPSLWGADLTAQDIIRQAMDHFRGQTSYSRMTMIIHRPDWERRMTMRAWTEGDEKTLVRVVEPPGDAGNGTLLLDNNMWSFAPRINRVIKIPSSMMSQNWMGSDFSNRDISKSTDILDEYDHTLLSTEESDGHTVYTIQAVPKEHAAVVWGREVLRIRDDWVMLEHQFRDQADVLVKRMRALEIEEMDGRMVASRLRMASEEEPDSWTELQTEEVDFNVELSPQVFTLSNLRNPRR